MTEEYYERTAEQIEDLGLTYLIEQDNLEKEAAKNKKEVEQKLKEAEKNEKEVEKNE